MCCCDKPNVNGEFGYKWNNPSDVAITRPVNPPAVEEGDTIIFDEPGRCGGIDSHSFHYRLIRDKYGMVSLLVRHGGGDERIPRLSNEKETVNALNNLDSNGRYWILNSVYHAHKDAELFSRNKEMEIWRQAAADKRIKTRKLPSRGMVKVWIEERR